MARGAQSAWLRHCPACDEGEISMNLWDSGRIRVRRCPACGKQIEYRVPSLPYYSFAAVMFVFWSASPILILFLAFKGHWQWGLGAALVALIVMALINLVFNRILIAGRVGELRPEEIDYHRKLSG